MSAAGAIRGRSGSWWLATDPSRKVIGTLTREADAWQLQLVGTLPGAEARDDDRLALIRSTTLFGGCEGRRLTLIHAYFSGRSSWGGPSPREDITDAQFTETWTGYGLIDGGHVTEETRYTAASCDMPGLDVFWPESGLTGSMGAVDEYEPPAPLHVDCGDGVSVGVFASSTSTFGMRVRSIEEVIRLSVRAERGLTLRQITDDILGPIKMLMAVNFNRDVDYANLAMLPAAGDAERWVAVDPDVRSAAAEPAALLPRDALFDANRVDVGSVLAEWLQLARVSVIAMAVAAPHDRRTMLQDEVVGIVNAAETLHRIRHRGDVAAESAFAAKVKAALPQLEGTLNSEERRQVATVVAAAANEMTLERRLRQLAGDLGAGFCNWFFGGHVAAWAFVSSTLRNALSHGYETRHGLEKDTSALIAVYQVTRAVVQISLLVAAGLPIDGALVDLLRTNSHYRAVKDQAVLDWAAAATTMRTPATPPPAAPAG